MLLHFTFYLSLQKKECGNTMDSDEHSDNEVQEPEQQHEDLLEHRSWRGISERSGRNI